MGIEKNDTVLYQGAEYLVLDIKWCRCSETWMNYKKLSTSPSIPGYPFGIREELVEAKEVVAPVEGGVEYCFKTFRLRSHKPDFHTKPDEKWKKLPSFEWNKFISVDAEGNEVPYNYQDLQDKKQSKKHVDYFVHHDKWKQRSTEELMETNCGVPCGKINRIWVLDLDFYGSEYDPATCEFVKQFGDLDTYIKENNL